MTSSSDVISHLPPLLRLLLLLFVLVAVLCHVVVPGGVRRGLGREGRLQLVQTLPLDDETPLQVLGTRMHRKRHVVSYASGGSLRKEGTEPAC